MPRAKIIISLLEVIILNPYAADVNYNTNKLYITPFKVTKDAANPLKPELMNGIGRGMPGCEEENIMAFSLKELMEKAGQLSGDYNILVKGDDGLASEVDGDNACVCSAVFPGKSGWTEVNEDYHPGKIKRITGMAVVGEDGFCPQYPYPTLQAPF
jgi:hypothetical protein